MILLLLIRKVLYLCTAPLIPLSNHSSVNHLFTVIIMANILFNEAKTVSQFKSILKTHIFLSYYS